MLVLSPRFAAQNFRGMLKEMRAENPDKNEDDAGCRFGAQRFTPPNLPMFRLHYFILWQTVPSIWDVVVTKFEFVSIN
jgi:hypothetical protein